MGIQKMKIKKRDGSDGEEIVLGSEIKPTDTIIDYVQQRIKMKTVTEKKTIEKTVHKYISNDGNLYQINLVFALLQYLFPYQ